MTFSLRQLQTEQVDWVRHNFSNPETGAERPSWMPLMGVCEELGELVEAATAGHHSPEFYDGVADAIIFASDYCTAMGWDLQDIWDNGREQYGMDTKEHVRVMLVCIGRLQHHYLKTAQGIRGDAATHDREGQVWLGRLLFELAWIAGGDEEVHRHVASTWAVVRQRDWRKNATSGT
jgi:hypothetical protein